MLMYHQVGDFPPMRAHRANYCDHRRFASQMAYLKGFGYSVLTIDQVLACMRGERPIPPRAVSLTFDDGYESFLTYALPVLERCGFQATVYAVAGLIGQRARWLGEGWKQPLPKLMNADQLKEIRASGMTIGSHTMRHPRLAESSSEQQRRELADSRAALEDLLGAEVRHLCYPYGSFNLEAVHNAAASGYASATTCLRGPVEPCDHPLVLPRKAISFGDNLIGYFWKLAIKNRPKPQLLEWRRRMAA